MRLHRVEIKNFRSIEDATIEFEPRCRILVGINESGKSNILKAINTLNQAMDVSFDSNDKRQPLKNEGELESSYVKFIFNFEKNEKEELKNEFLKEFTINEEKEIIFQHEKKGITFKDFYSKNIQYVFFADYIAEKKYFYCSDIIYNLEKNKRSLSSDWKKVNKSLPEPLIVNYNGNDVDIRNFSFVNIKNINTDTIIENYGTVPPEICEEIEQETLNHEILKLIKEKIHKIACQKIPKIIFWKYSEENILPTFVEKATFAENSKSCLPLENMFSLFGTFDIKKEFEKHKSSSSDENPSFDNYLTRVANRTEEYFSEVWPEYKNIGFSLNASGEKIQCRVGNNIKYNFSQRSDGFLRFLSFLLMVSIKIKNDGIENNILLIDEPEVGLHPSSVRYLLQELIKISKNNIVVISTHSTFMIDKKEIGRHLIVEKKEEKTVIKHASKSNFFAEEVLHNALGTSMFDTMKAKILLFEGYWDRRLFEVFIKVKKNTQ